MSDSLPHQEDFSSCLLNHCPCVLVCLCVACIPTEEAQMEDEYTLDNLLQEFSDLQDDLLQM